MTSDLEFIYVGDPMCSWCWGFAPVLERMTEVYEIPIRVVVGGISPMLDLPCSRSLIGGYSLESLPLTV